MKAPFVMRRSLRLHGSRAVKFVEPVPVGRAIGHLRRMDRLADLLLDASSYVDFGGHREESFRTDPAKPEDAALKRGVTWRQ